MPEEKPDQSQSPGPTPPHDSGSTAAPAEEAKPIAAGAPQAEPLSDGTMPTILATGTGEPHAKLPKGRASITSIYRRADVTTTLVTFVTAMVTTGLILGAYIYLTKDQPGTSTAPPKVTSLSNDELAKLGGFLSSNSEGKPADILTFNSASLFKNRMAIDSDLKVTGAIAASGPTSLGDLVVDKTSTLGVTNVRGQLSVSGPLTVRSPAVFENGGTFTGNLTVSGNGTFGGTLGAGTINATNLSVTGSLNVGGHVTITSGNKPTATGGTNAAVDGTDAAGTVTVTAGSGGSLVQINFKTAFPKTPHVLLTPSNAAAGGLHYYVTKTGTFFLIAADNAVAGQTYSFDYWVVD